MASISMKPKFAMLPRILAIFPKMHIIDVAIYPLIR